MNQHRLILSYNKPRIILLSVVGCRSIDNNRLLFISVACRTQHGDMLTDEPPVGDLKELLEEAKIDFRETQLEVKALEKRNEKLEKQVRSLLLMSL